MGATRARLARAATGARVLLGGREAAGTAEAPARAKEVATKAVSSETSGLRAQLRRPQLQRWRPPSASAEWFPHSESAKGSARPVFLVAQCLEFVQSLGSAVASTCFFKQLSRWRVPTAIFQLCSRYSKQKGCARLREGRGVLLGARKRRRTNPWAAFRVGEALRPGPNQDARRQRALHALAQMGLTSEIPVVRELEPPPSPGASEADTLTDTLSATTPFASPRAPGDVAPTAPDVATLGFTPTAAPDWHGVGPPTAAPGVRLSWLYVPLLHAAAGNLAPEADAALGRYCCDPA